MQLRFLIFCVFAMTLAPAKAFTSSTDPIPPQLEYVANGGQWPAIVKYRALVSGGGALWVRNDGYTLSLRHPEDDAWIRDHHHGEHEDDELAHRAAPNPGKKIRYEALEVNFLGGQADYTLAEEVLPYHHNYFRGSDPSRWATDVPLSRGVRMQEVYSGIDLRLYSQSVMPKYDWILEPGADPSLIQMEYKGVREMHLNQGQLAIKGQFQDWVEQTPYAYQMIQGEAVAVVCQFKLEDNVVSFEFPYGYDPTHALVIDPVLVFSTYTGSVADNWGFTACFDDTGNAYSGGIVFDVGFPTTIGAFQEDFSGAIDMGIISYDSVGSTLRYATYIGGLESDVPQSLLVGPDSSLYILGITGSNDFPTSAGAVQGTFQGGPFTSSPATSLQFPNGIDVVVTRLSFLGNDLLSATYLGGSQNDGYKESFNGVTVFYGDDFRGDIITDSIGNVFIASTTSSLDFPMVNANQASYGGGATDGMLVSLTQDLSSIRWGTYLGGSNADCANSVKIAKDGSVYVGGATNSSNFSAISGGILTSIQGGSDGFVSSFNSAGVLQSGTFLGTTSRDNVFFIDIDTAGMIYAFGVTFGSYPVQGDVYSVANSGHFLHQLTPELDSTNWSTVFGGGVGAPEFSPTAFLVNDCGNIYVAGWTGQLTGDYFGRDGFNLPTTFDAYQASTDGNDFYLTVLNRQASELLYGTFFGEQGNNDHVDGGTSRFDKRGIVYQSVCASCFTSGSGFPTTPNAWSQTNNSNNCNNATFKFDLSSLQAAFQTNTPALDQPGISVGCIPLTILFENESQGGLEFIWNFGDGTETRQTENMDVTHTYDQVGVYQVVLTVVDANTCLVRDSAVATIEAREGNFSIDGDATICLGEQTQLSSSGGVSYTWIPPFGLNDNTIANPIASPTQTTTFTLRAVDAFGCRYEDSVQVEVIGDIGVFFDVEQTVSCLDNNEVAFENLTTNGESFEWDFGDGTTSTEASPVHEYDEDGNYTVTLTVSNAQCQAVYSRQIGVRKYGVPTVITPNGDGINDTFVINTLEEVDLKVFNRWGREEASFENYQNNWGGGVLVDGVYYIEVTLPTGEACKGPLTIIR